MKTINKHGDQGDVKFIRVNKLPDDVKLSEDGVEVVVAHSETSHHHIATVPAKKKVRLYKTADPMVGYLESDEPHIDIVHLRDYDTHETLRLKGGPWKIIRQREETPEGWRQVID
jgi:hypothetical protein